MKKATITITFDQEKLRAIQFYAGKKDASLTTELNEYMEKLYEKYVPAQTREYIQSQSEPVGENPKRPARPVPQPATSASQE